MGDRGNIIVRESDDSSIYLYAHHRGSEIPDSVAKTLERARDRWSDTAYLTRCLFDDLVDGDRDTTGFGISTRMQDTGTDVMVNPREQSVTWMDGREQRTASFDAFLEMMRLGAG